VSCVKTVSTMLTAVAALGVIACGGSSDDKLSRSELADNANKTCAKYQAQLRAVREPADITDATQAASYFRSVQRIGHKARGELTKLKPADDVKADYDAYLAAQAEGMRLLDTLLNKAEARDRSGLQDLQKLVPLGKKTSAAASKAGLTTCAAP
jgi:hypothetical protein